MKHFVPISLFVISSLSLLSGVPSRADDLVFTENGFAADVIPKQFSNRIQAVDDLILLPTGQVYVLDSARGRVQIFEDRGLDGRADTSRTLPQQFDFPSSFVLQNGQLFVADKTALWRLERQGGKTRIVDLTNSRAQGPIHLAAGDSPDSLVIALTRDATATLIDLTLSTGAASIRAETLGKVLAVKRLQNGTLWTSVKGEDGTSQFSLDMRGTGPALKGVMSDFTIMPKPAPSIPNRWNGELIALMGNGNVTRATMHFGRPELPGHLIFKAMKERAQTTPSQTTGILEADARGVFFFDPKEKALWVINPRPPQALNPTVSPTSPDDKTPDP